jgi:hypothetical protein
MNVVWTASAAPRKLLTAHSCAKAPNRTHTQPPTATVSMNVVWRMRLRYTVRRQSTDARTASGCRPPVGARIWRHRRAKKGGEVAVVVAVAVAVAAPDDRRVAGAHDLRTKGIGAREIVLKSEWRSVQSTAEVVSS